MSAEKICWSCKFPAGVYRFNEKFGRKIIRRILPDKEGIRSVLKKDRRVIQIQLRPYQISSKDIKLLCQDCRSKRMDKETVQMQSGTQTKLF